MLLSRRLVVVFVVGSLRRRLGRFRAEWCLFSDESGVSSVMARSWNSRGISWSRKTLEYPRNAREVGASQKERISKRVVCGSTGSRRWDFLRKQHDCFCGRVQYWSGSECHNNDGHFDKLWSCEEMRWLGAVPLQESTASELVADSSASLIGGRCAVVLIIMANGDINRVVDASRRDELLSLTSMIILLLEVSIIFRSDDDDDDDDCDATCS
jgi:hypothetical protein